MPYNPIKRPDGLYEVTNAAGYKMWVEEHILKAAIAALQAKGIDPQEKSDALIHACADEIDKGLIPGAELITNLLLMGIGTEDMGDLDDEYEDYYYDDDDIDEDQDDDDDSINPDDSEDGFDL